MAKFVYRDGMMVDKDTGQPMLDEMARKAPPALPQVMGFQEYACPVTGKPISTLEQHNANLKLHGCIEAKEAFKSPTNGEIRNERFAAKHGLKVSDRYKDEPWKPKSLQN